MAVEQTVDVLLPSRKVIVQTDDVMPLRNEPLAQMRPQKARAAGDQNPFRFRVVSHIALTFTSSMSCQISSRVTLDGPRCIAFDEPQATAMRHISEKENFRA